MLIRCTAKLLKEMGLVKADLVDNLSESPTLGEWYANLFFAGRKKCVIFTNARTLFTFISFYVNKAQIKDLGSLFRLGLGRALLNENLEGPLIKRLVDECQAIQFARTNNRSVMGVMVDHVKSTKWMLMDHYHRKRDFSEIIKELNQTPLLTQRFSYSIEEFRRVLGINNKAIKLLV